MPHGRIPPGIRQIVHAGRQPVPQHDQRQVPNARGSEFERKGQAAHPAADVDDDVGSKVELWL